MRNGQRFTAVFLGLAGAAAVIFFVEGAMRMWALSPHRQGSPGSTAILMGVG